MNRQVTDVAVAVFAICVQRLLAVTVCVRACDEKKLKSSIWWYNIRLFGYFNFARQYTFRRIFGANLRRTCSCLGS